MVPDVYYNYLSSFKYTKWECFVSGCVYRSLRDDWGSFSFAKLDVMEICLKKAIVSV